jgi:excisionase family DNA binding protein
MEKLLTPEAAADRLAVSRNTILAWLQTGQLKGVKAGRLWRIREHDLEDFLKEPVLAPKEAQPPAVEGEIDWERYDAMKARQISRRMIARELGIPETTLRRLEKRRGEASR